MTMIEKRSASVPNGLTDFIGVYVCDSCRHVNLGTFRGPSDTYRGSVESTLLSNQDSITWLPSEALGKDFPDVPPAIAEAASEVHACLSIRATRAAIAVARAVVEATAKEKKITSGTLQQKIDELAEQGLIREYTREAAHEVRLDGNSIAHGDLAIEPPDAEEAAEIVALMDELLEEVYQSPARIARVRVARDARKQATLPGSP